MTPNPLKIAITGGSDGLGLELAKYFATHHQAHVAMCGTRQAGDIHINLNDYPTIFYKSIDLTTSNGPQHFLDFMDKAIGNADIFLNNAVSFQEENLLTDSRQFFLDQFLINTIVPLELTQHLYQRQSLNHKGPTTLIMMNTEAAIQPKTNLATYAATKSALLNYTKSLAMTMRGSSLSVCSLIMGPLATPYYQSLYEEAAKQAGKNLPEFIEAGLAKTFPAHTYPNLVSMEEVGKTILFLHDLGMTKNGCAWRLDGGVVPIAL